MVKQALAFCHRLARECQKLFSALGQGNVIKESNS